MIEYNRHIQEYSVYSYSSFSNLISSESWGDKALAEKYLQKYWLPEKEYLTVWKPVQDKIFVKGECLPELIYQSEFELTAFRGGSLFREEDFKQFQNLMREIGDEYFVVIQHSQIFTEGEPMFQMKFPVDITWDELVSGNYISAVLLEMSYNEYYVFGSKGNWGKYSANDYENPLDIFGSKPEFTHVIRKYFIQSKEEQEKIRAWLPLVYRELIN